MVRSPAADLSAGCFAGEFTHSAYKTASARQCSWREGLVAQPGQVGRASLDQRESDDFRDLVRVQRNHAVATATKPWSNPWGRSASCACSMFIPMGAPSSA